MNDNNIDNNDVMTRTAIADDVYEGVHYMDDEPWRGTIVRQNMVLPLEATQLYGPSFPALAIPRVIVTRGYCSRGEMENYVGGVSAPPPRYLAASPHAIRQHDKHEMPAHRDKVVMIFALTPPSPSTKATLAPRNGLPPSFPLTAHEDFCSHYNGRKSYLARR
jgi:hypothetical protein